jgi:hypothetical protein
MGMLAKISVVLSEIGQNPVRLAFPKSIIADEIDEENALQLYHAILFVEAKEACSRSVNAG